MTVQTLQTSARRVRRCFLAKSGVFCHRRNNHSHIYKNIGVAKRSDNEEQGDKRIVVPVQAVGDGGKRRADGN